MKRTWTIIGVRDVAGSFRWYQSLFCQPEMPPAHDDFGQILDSDGTVLLCLHKWGAHEHPSLMSPDEASPGNVLVEGVVRPFLRDAPVRRERLQPEIVDAEVQPPFRGDVEQRHELGRENDRVER